LNWIWERELTAVGSVVEEMDSLFAMHAETIGVLKKNFIRKIQEKTTADVEEEEDEKPSPERAVAPISRQRANRGTDWRLILWLTAMNGNGDKQTMP
jgi:hypothetical protein